MHDPISDAVTEATLTTCTVLVALLGGALLAASAVGLYHLLP